MSRILASGVGSVATPDYALGVAVAGDRAYVACFESGLRVVDISNPSAPVIVGSMRAPGDGPRPSARVIRSS